MTNTKKACWWALTSLFLAATAAAKTCVWTASTVNWSDPTSWADGVMPEAGDDVALVGPSGAGGNLLLEGVPTVALSAISNTNASSGWTFTNGTVNLAAGTVVMDNVGTLQFRAQLASPDTTTSVKRGGGMWFGELAAGGALTVTGTPVIGLPSDPGAAYRKTLFTYTSIDAASTAALASATFDPAVTLPKGLKARLAIGATSCVLTVAADDTIMVFR